VSSYLTISPLLLAETRGGVFLWHFPSSRPDRTLSCTLPSEARTFLTPSGAVIWRAPRGHYTTGGRSGTRIMVEARRLELLTLTLPA
jgi:hypothetical protein